MERVKGVLLPSSLRLVLLRGIASLVFLAMFVSAGFAQLKSPGVDVGSFKFGIEAGNGWHKQSGEFSGPCSCADEQGATGSGFVGSIFFELPKIGDFVFGLKAGLDHKNASSSSLSKDTAVVFGSEGTVDTVGGFEMNHTGTYKLTYFFIAPYVQYQLIPEGAFIQIAPSVSVMVANHLLQAQSFANDSVHYPGGTIAPLFSNGAKQETIMDGNIPEVSSLRVSALLSAGWNISLLGFTLAPMVTYDLPLTNVRNANATGWKVSSINGTIALKFGL